MVFLMETKLRKQKMEIIRSRLGFPNMIAVDSKGRSGGLAMLWGEDIHVEIQNYSQRHINGRVSIPGGGGTWMLTGFYGHPDPSKRYEAWALLTFLKNQISGPWVCLGDFNEILYSSEKWGGNTRTNSQMDAFQQVLNRCQLFDLGYKGAKYTWSNFREGSGFVKERLDRGVANTGWRDLFPDAEVCVEEVTWLDHTPLALCTERIDTKKGRTRHFRYEAQWAMEDGYRDTIMDAWTHNPNSGERWECIKTKLSLCRQGLTRWRTWQHGSEMNRIATLHKRLLDVQGSEEDNCGDMAIRLRRELQELMEKADLHWRQRAKIDWLKSGDRNTRYFHSCATSRKKKNTITSILDVDNQNCTTDKEVKLAFIS
jgi:hypothetical protein